VAAQQWPLNFLLIKL